MVLMLIAVCKKTKQKQNDQCVDHGTDKSNKKREHCVENLIPPIHMSSNSS